MYDQAPARVLRTINRVRKFPQFQGYLDYTQLSQAQQKRADELTGQHADVSACLFGIVAGQITQVVTPEYTYLVQLTEASE